MSISLEEVNKIAKLARLTFSDVEKQKLQQELSAILDYVDQLKELSGKTSFQITDDPDAVNLVRDDVVDAQINPQEFLAQVPAREGKFIKVKSVLE